MKNNEKNIKQLYEKLYKKFGKFFENLYKKGKNYENNEINFEKLCKNE